MRGLVVGRFQPLHKGHEALIRRAMEDCVHVVVAIGSSNAKQDTRNPFTKEERRQMIAAVFHEEAGDDLQVMDLPDIHDPPNWVPHVLERTGAVDKVFGNDDRTLDLFDAAGITVVRTGHVDRDRYRATTIRMQMAEGDGAWTKAVPGPVAALLQEWDAEHRLRRLEAYA